MTENFEPGKRNPCVLCWAPVDVEDPEAWKEVKGFVGGPKKDSMRLRADTGNYAHDKCVQAEMRGMPPEQTDLFEQAEALPEPVEKRPMFSDIDATDPMAVSMDPLADAQADTATDFTSFMFGPKS